MRLTRFKEKEKEIFIYIYKFVCVSLRISVYLGAFSFWRERERWAGPRAPWLRPHPLSRFHHNSWEMSGGVVSADPVTRATGALDPLTPHLHIFSARFRSGSVSVWILLPPTRFLEIQLVDFDSFVRVHPLIR